MGPNVLALGPRRALAVDANPVTRERLEAAGVDVTTYPGAHISVNGDGGPDVPHASVLDAGAMIDLWVFLHIACVASFLLFHGVQMWALFAIPPAFPDREKMFDRAEQSRMASTPMYASLGLLRLFGVIAGIDGSWFSQRLVAVGRDRRAARHRRAR